MQEPVVSGVETCGFFCYTVGMEECQMDIRSMRYILEVIKTGSFTKAAHNLYISPQALGKTVRAVEEELDTELFIRDTHSLQTTAFGRAFGREAEACVAAYEQACMRINALARQAAGSINIACAYGIPSALGYENPSVLRQILKQRTGLELDIAFDELPDLLAERELREETCDIGLLMGAPEHAEDYETVLLRMHHLVAVVREGHPLAGRASISMRELADWPVASRNQYYRSYHVLETCARRQQVTLHYALCSPDEALWRQKVQQGVVGIGVSFREGSARQAGFVLIPFEEKDMVYPIYLARKKDHVMDENLHALWETIAAG